MWFAEPSIALVGDNSFAAFTSPVQGERYRIQFTPTFGSVHYQTALLDYRRYIFMRPVHVRVPRHVDRPLRQGRGRSEHDVADLSRRRDDDSRVRLRLVLERRVPGERRTPATAPTAQVGCPTFQRLFGSKVAVVNTEFRIPLFGTEGFGLLNFPFLPTEVSPFFDAGVSYTNNQGPDFRFTRRRTRSRRTARRPATPTPDQIQQQAYYPCADRIPVFSTGLSFRFNLMGYAIMEAYIAHPFQRPKKNWVWGFQLAPGW